MADQTPGRRRTSPPASPLDDDDLLREILVRVPPAPSWLPRASLVCKRWRRLVGDPWFLRRLCAHHRKAPLLGFFTQQRFGEFNIVFNPILEPPDRIPPRRVFSPGRSIVQPLDCRHGRLALIDVSQDQEDFHLFVCDPISGGLARLAAPPEFRSLSIGGAVLCAAGEQGHVHGACHSSPFKVVLVSTVETDRRLIACVYSSVTGMWGRIVWHDPCGFLEFSGFNTLLVGRALYWLFSFKSQDEEEEDGHIHLSYGIIEFDLDRQSLMVMKGLPINNGIPPQIIKIVDGGVGLVSLSYPTLQLWHRKVNCHHVATWMPIQTVDLHSIFGLPEHDRWVARMENILGYDEDDDVLFICLDSSLFMLQLGSMQFKMLFEWIEREYFSFCLPFRCFYTTAVLVINAPSTMKET